MIPHRRSRPRPVRWLALSALLVLPTAARAQTSVRVPVVRQQRYLGLDQMLTVMQDSRVAYNILALDQLRTSKTKDLADLFFPGREKRVDRPWIEESGGKRRLIRYPLDPRAARLIARGERLLRKGRMKESRKAFESALGIQPGCYLALVHLGRWHLKEGSADEALGFFNRAVVFNPDDADTYRYKGDAAAALGLLDQARAHYVEALARAPRDPATLAALTRHQRRLGVTVVSDLFRPRALARREGGQISIYVDHNDPSSRIWMAYAAAKAVWAGELQVRSEYGGAEKDDWSTEEEFFCLYALLGHYLAARERGIAARDPALERIKSILGAGYLFEYVLYEMASRTDPNIMVKLDIQQRRRMERFIDGFAVPGTK